MHLRYCEFEDANSIEKLFSGCPVLEKFTLEECKCIRLPFLRKFIQGNRINLSGLSVSQKVQHLDICINGYVDPFTVQSVPYPIFDYQSLRSLKLSLKEITLEQPDCISLPCLKVMHLHFYEFPNANSFEKMFSCCHVLEELAILDCNLSCLKSITISIPSLKRLTMGVEEHILVDVKNSCYITIEGPTLSSFNYTGRLPNHFYLTKTSSSSTIKACIHITRPYFLMDERRAPHFVKLLQGLENMVSLTISNSTEEVLSLRRELSDHLPVFHHLEYLDFNMELNGDDLHGLLKLFYFTPKLAAVQFSKGVQQQHVRKALGFTPKSLPSCFSSSLKILVLHKFHGHTYEFSFLDNFLEKAVSLRRINIFLVENINLVNQEQLTENLKKLSARSKHCAINIVE